MGNILYLVAAIMIILWAVGFIVYSVGAIIHLLLFVALIAIVMRIMQGRKPL